MGRSHISYRLKRRSDLAKIRYIQIRHIKMLHTLPGVNSIATVTPIILP